MRNWLIGTGLVISGGVLAIAMMALGFPRLAVVGISIAIATCGFVIQMYTAFSGKMSFERGLREKQRQHEALMKRAQKLSPEQAIQLLLRGAD